MNKTSTRTKSSPITGNNGMYNISIKKNVRTIKPTLNFKRFLKAAEEGNFIFVKSWIDNKKNILCYTSDFQTALHLAAGNGHIEICQILLENGVNPYITDINGLDPLAYACTRNNKACALLIVEHETKNKSLEEAYYHILRIGRSKWLDVFHWFIISRNKTVQNQILKAFKISYDKINVKKLIIQDDMRFCVLQNIVRLQYLKENRLCYDELDENKRENRITLINSQFQELKLEMNNEKHENSGDLFLFLLKMILKNLYILDQTTNALDKEKLPWIEIEFLISLFILCNERVNINNINYKLVLSKMELISYIQVFLSELTNMKTEKNVTIVKSKKKPEQRNKINIVTNDINNSKIKSVSASNSKKRLNSENDREKLKKKAELKSKRKLIPKEQRIMENKMKQNLMKFTSAQRYRNKIMKNLSKKYRRLKSIHSLERILCHLDVVNLIADFDEVSVYAIKRALQVIGECLKSGEISPNISINCRQILEKSGPSFLQQILTKVRQLLTHSTSLDSSKSVNTNLYQRVKHDLRQIYNPIQNLLDQEKNYSIKVFFYKILKCKDLKQLKEVYQNVEVFETFIKLRHVPQLQQIKCIWSEFIRNCVDITDEDKIHINIINKIFENVDELNKMHTQSILECYYNITMFKKMSNILEDVNFIRKFFFCRFNFLKHMAYYTNNKSVCIIIAQNIEKLLNSYRTKLNQENNTDLLQFILIYLFENENKINSINKLKSNLEYIPIFEIESRIENVFDYIRKEFKNCNLSFIDLEQQIKKEKKIHQGKIKMNKFIKKNDYSENSSKELAEIANEYGIEIKKLDQKYQEGKIGINVKNVESSFGKLLNEMKKFIKDPLNLVCQRTGFQSFFKAINTPDTDEEIKIKEILDKYEKICIKSIKQKCISLKLDLMKQFPNYSADKNKLWEDYKNYSGDLKRRLTIEMILLEICEIIYHGKNSKAGFLDDYSPILTGRDLRNYVAHGNIVFKALTTDPCLAVFINALYFAEIDFATLWDLKCEGKVNSANIDVLEVYKSKLSWIKIQMKMFQMAKTNNLDGLKTCLTNGADMKGHDTDKRSLLNFAIDGNCRNFISYISNFYGYNLLPMSSSTEIFYDFILNNRETYSFGVKDYYHIVNKFCSNATQTLFGCDIWLFVYDRRYDVECNLFLTFILAIEFNYHDIVEMFYLKNIFSDILGKTNDFLLNLAMTSNNTKIIKVFLKDRSCINKKLPNDITLLHLATIQNNLEIVKILCINGAEVNFVCMTGEAALDFAARYGHEKIVSELLKHNVRKENNSLALTIAADSGSEGIIKQLLKYGYDVHGVDCNNINLLYRAVISNNINLVKLLIKLNVDINCVDIYGISILQNAILLASKEVIMELLRVEDININHICNKTALHYACIRGSKLIVKLLVAANADINAKDERKITPLIDALEMKHLKVAKLLIESGAALDQSLEFAIKTQNFQIIKYLLAKGAHHNEADSSILHTAIESNEEKILNHLIEKKIVNLHDLLDGKYSALHTAVLVGSQKMIQILLDYGMDINICNKNGETPLSISVFMDSSEMITYLVSKGAKINHVNIKLQGYLHLTKSLETLTTLLEDGADVNIRDECLNTPLHYAVQLQQLEHIKALIHHEADLNCINIDGASPLDIAKANNFTHIIELLRKFEALDDPLITKNNLHYNELLVQIKTKEQIKDTYYVQF